MKISEEEVRHIAKLAKLKLSDAEVEKLESELGSIKEFIEVLNEVDVSKVNPTAHIQDTQNVFREDKVEESFDRESILANAPSKEAGCFTVPRVVE